jgi:hypothetical protein
VRQALTLLAAFVAVLAVAAPASARRVELGLSDGPGGAKKLRRAAHFGYRYQYLAGGVNTGDGWATWNPNGTFASMYARESRREHVTPVLTYYMIRQSLPGRDDGDELRADLGNLRNRGTMRAMYSDLRLLFKRLHGRGRVIVHVEPDLWGYGEQAARHDDARTVRAVVKSSGVKLLHGLPNNLSGFARAVVRLRNRYARNVRLGYHVSVWGTKTDVALQNPPNRQVDRLARRASKFERSLHARFDMAFAEFSDRDAAFKQIIYGDGGASWWNAADFSRDIRFDRVVHRRTHLRLVKWQIPLGNALMRAMNNTWGHYQDNRVQWLLGAHSHAHLRRYARAGVVAFLFGGGADGTTCACDAQNDGVTNPAPIDGNKRRSLSADDDGGYFKSRARAYYRHPLRLR